MNSTTNSSAPTSPAGTSVKAVTDSLSAAITGNSTVPDQTDIDSQLPTKLSRSRSLSEISPGESPGEAPTTKKVIESRAPATESLKVKIKTNNITKTIFATSTATNDSNNNTSNNINNLSGTINNNGNDNKAAAVSPTSSSSTSPVSTPKSTNNRAGTRKGKQNSNDTGSTTSKSSSINSSFSSTRSSSPAISTAMSPTKPQPVMNSHASSSLSENGREAATVVVAPIPPPPTSSNQPSQVQPIPPAQQQIPLQTQSQQQPLPPALPQPQVSTDPPRTLSPAKLPVATPTPSQTTPKPKVTRAKKQSAANNKNATATNAIATKPETKTRTKKAKLTTETKSSSAAVPVPTTLAPSQQLHPTATTTAATKAPPSSASDKKLNENQRQATTNQAKKRKPRAPPDTDTNAQPTNPPKRTRKKKAEQAATNNDTHINQPPLMSTNMTLPPLSVNPQLLSVASSIPMGTSPLMSNAPQPAYQTMQPLNINRSIPGISPLDVHDNSQRYVSVSLSPYANHDYTNSLARQHSLSKLLFTSSTSSATQTNPHSEEIAKAFEELRDHTWSHLSKCILEPAQQFDIPSLIGTLYELRGDNEKQLKRIKELTLQREQLAAMNAKLDLSGPMLLQNLNQTSPGFASVVAGLQNSPKSLPNSSPSPAMNKSPIVPGGPYNHVPPGSSLGPPGILYDRNSPMVGLQTQHSGVNSLKSTMISTPSPPTSAFMAHGANNRAGLMTVNNSPYMSNVHPSMSALNPLGGQPPPSYYPRQ